MPSATPFLASSAVQRFLDLALPVSRAGSAEQFYDALKAGYLGVHARLTDDRSGEEAQALRDAFEATQSNLAQRLAFCAFRSHAPDSSSPTHGAARKRIFDPSCPDCLQR